MDADQSSPPASPPQSSGSSSKKGGISTTGKVLLGCGIVVVLAVLGFGFVAIYSGARTYKKFMNVAATQARFDSAVASWAPPSDTESLEAWFPENVGAYRRTGVDEKVSIPRLNFEEKARHATYSAGEGKSFEAAIFPTTEDEFETIRRQIDGGLRDSGRYLPITLTDQYHFQQLSEPALSGYLYKIGEYTIFVWNADGLGWLELMIEFLEAASASPSSVP